MKFIAIVSAFLFALVESRRRTTPTGANPAPAAATAPVDCSSIAVKHCNAEPHCRVSKEGRCKKTNKPKAAPAAAAPGGKHRRNY